MKTNLPPVATEKEFQQAIIDLAKLLGFACYHSWTSIHSEPGFPDLCLVGGPGIRSIRGSKRLVFAEVKGVYGKVTDFQRQWLDRLSETEAEVYLWRVGDWAEVEQILRHHHKPPAPPSLSAYPTAWSSQI